MRNFKQLTIDYYCKIYYEHYIVNSIHRALYTVHCALINVFRHFSLNIVHYAVYTLQCVMYIVQCILGTFVVSDGGKSNT